MMKSKTFTSPAGWFSLTLPREWDEYDDGEDGTFAFFNSKKWTGNLRITPFRWAKVENSIVDQAAAHIERELLQNSEAKRISWGPWLRAHYRETINQDEDMLISYNWLIGHSNNLFLCSFTIDEEQEPTKENKVAIGQVVGIIQSIKIR